MNRPVYTALYSLMIVGLFFSLSVIYQSCGKKKQDLPSTEELADKVEDVADSYTEESFFEDDDTEEEATQELDESPDEEEQNSASDDYSSTSYSTPSASTLSPQGYMVIAGNYLLENNATQMVRKLKSAGYNNAEKVVFDLSQYYTVVAGIYESRSVANSISSELNGKGIDNYVLRRKN